MGIIIGSFALILGLLFIIIPKGMMNIFRLRGKGIYKKRGKIKFEIAKPPLYELMGEKKAVMFVRIIGVIFLIVSIFAFLSSSAP